MHDKIFNPVESNNGFLKTDDLPVREAQHLEGKEFQAALQFVAPPNLVRPDSEVITPEMLPLIELNQQQIDTIVQTVPGGAKNVQDIYPLSPLQEGMLFHRLLNQRSDTYVLSSLFELRSQLQVGVLINALQEVIDRHDILRSALLWEHLPRPVQVVYRRATLPVHELALDRDRDAVGQLKELMRPGRQRLDLRQAPLARLQVVGEAHGGKWYALLQLHHLVCDYQSLRVVIAEAMACLEDREQDLPTPVPYRNYVAQALAHGRTDEAEKFFRSKLAQIEEPTAPFGLFDVHGDGERIEEASRMLEPALAQQIRSEARRMGVSAARFFHAAWGLVMAHTSQRNDVVYGTVLLAAQQRSAQAQRMLGMSVNTLPLRLQLQGLTAKELVEHTHRELLQLLNYEHAPLAVAQRCSGIPGTAPLFTALLNFRHSAPDAEWSSEAGVRVLAQGEAWTNYPITLLVDDSGTGFLLSAQTDRRVDPHRILGYLQTAMHSLVEALRYAPHTPALALSILPESERREVIELFNATRADYPLEQLIHELFEQQVQRSPDAIAVLYEGESLTYTELNWRANQVAHYLRGKGVGPDQLVGLCLERSLEMVVGLLGVLKAGAAYVPLDPNYPAERLAYILQDAAPRVVLTQRRLMGALRETGAQMVALDADSQEIAQELASNPDGRSVGLHSGHLAYVIYTSGSTGKPKGVMVEHRNVTRLFAATAAWFEFNEQDVWTLFHSIAFDFSVWELWGALFYGGRVVVVPYATARSAQEFYELLCAQGVTVLNQTPSAFVQLIDAQAHSDKRHSLRVVIFGGEALELRTLQPWVRRNAIDQPQLVNMYGITETTVHVTYRRLSVQEIESERGSLIGRPIPDLRVYLLDVNQQPVPIGVVGEMYVGGAGVARGYLNRVELTAERFVCDPFSGHSTARMYKTGDLGRWRADGTIEYLGRNDHQVKVRGFRIELGEIEAQLVRQEQVKEAVVIAREDVPGEKRLVAYVIAQEPAAAPSVEGLRGHLKRVLPEYMVPSAFVMLEDLPLTANGKLDRRALPAPELSAYVSRQYEAPAGEVEEMLAEIWQQLLQVAQVGREDNFFELGGHSLLAMQMVARIQSSLPIEIPIRTLFDSPTVKQFSAQIEDLRRVRLSDGIADGGAEMEELFATVASMRESKVQELLSEFTREARP